MIGKNYTVFLADTTINERPSAEQLAHIARKTAKVAQRLGHEPRVAFLSYSTFGNPSGKWLDSIRGAVSILDEEKPNFEYEGEMAPDAALNPKVMELYPFSRLSAPANVLVMPGLQSANLSAKLLRELAGASTIGPMLVGMQKPVQIAPMTAIAPDVLTLAVLAAAGVVDWANSRQLHKIPRQDRAKSSSRIKIATDPRLCEFVFADRLAQVDVTVFGVRRIDQHWDFFILES